jgi:hypothetical protein
MKSEQLYNGLKELAEKLGITVLEQSFKNTGIHVRSGLCRVKEQQMFIMNKHESIRSKVEILAECLAAFPLDDVFVVPAVRDVLDQFKAKVPQPAPNDSNTENHKDQEQEGEGTPGQN